MAILDNFGRVLVLKKMGNFEIQAESLKLPYLEIVIVIMITITLMTAIAITVTIIIVKIAKSYLVKSAQKTCLIILSCSDV